MSHRNIASKLTIPCRERAFFTIKPDGNFVPGQERPRCARYREMVGQLKCARLQAGMAQTEVAHGMGRCRTWVTTIEACELEFGILDLIGFCRVYGMRTRDVIALMDR